MKLSVTHLATYLYCKRKLWLREVLKLKEVPKAALIKGSVRHKIHERINKEEQAIVTSIQHLERTHILEMYQRMYREIMETTVSAHQKQLTAFDINLDEFQKYVWNLLSEEAEFRTDNVYQFIEKYKIFGNELWERLIPKIESEVRIDSDNLHLKGIIDQIMVYESGVVPVELKTGRMPREGVWPGHRIQLGAYALLLEEKHKLEVKEGFVHYLDGKERRHIAINPFLREEIKNLVSEVFTLIRSKEIPNRIRNQNKCQACGLRAQCYDDKLISKKASVLKQTTLE